MNQFIKFVASLGICFSPAFLASLLTEPPGQWYAQLDKPFFTPPGWVFGPAWTVLYFLMAVSLFLLWRQGFSQPKQRVALGWFIGQLILNALWTPAFFGMRSPGLGLIVIVMMVFAIAGTIFYVRRVSPPAAILLVPYLLWVCYAAALNGAIVVLN